VSHRQHRRWAVLALLSAALAVLMLARAAGATGGNELPLPIEGASLTQNGQDLVWYVRLGQASSAAALERDDASLCLLIERASNGAVASQVCVVPGARRRPSPQLIVTWGIRGRRVIAATVTRPTSESLQASFLPAAAGLSYGHLRWQVGSAVAAPACTPPAAPAPNPCVALSPAHPALLKLHTPQLVGCLATGPTWVFHGSDKVRDIALTFDDGPWVQTAQFLSVLERYHVPATFFQIGEWISVYGQHDALERRMLHDGDMIGDHTWTHPDYTGTGPYERMQVVAAADAIRDATGFYPCLFRAPYGNTSPSQLAQVRSLGMTTIQWDIDPRDWALPGVAEIEDNVIANAHNGGIVEMHDGGGPREETIDALPTIITTLRKRGYQFVTITQMLGYRLIYK
jgi:peptidoglycan-N-acetylglucosamine deacetylase